MLRLLLSLLSVHHVASTSSGDDGVCFDALNLCNLPCPNSNPRPWAAPNANGVLFPCCPEGMDMVAPPVRSSNYSITSSSQTYTPGELVTITIDVLGKGSKYIGLLLYAVEDGALETKVGEWVLPPEGGSPQFWTPPECTGKAVMHTDAGAKHYRHEFHFRAPVASIGNIRFRVLLKHGTTNGGAFFWPAEDLVLLKSSTISSGPIWVQSDNAASCTSACNAVESQCDAAALVAAHKQDRNNQLSEGPGQIFACHLPLFSYNGEACNMTTLSSDEDGRCFYRDDGLCIPTAEQICNEVAVTTHKRFCPCVRSSAGVPTSGVPSTSKISPTTKFLEPTLEPTLELSVGKHAQPEYFSFMVVVVVSGIRNPLVSFLAMSIFSVPWRVQAHNWKNNPPSRISGLTQESPCPARPGNSINFAVSQGERFGLEWTTGHPGRSSINYIAIVARGDEDKLRLNNAAVFEEYLRRAPNGAKSTDSGGFLSGEVFDKTHIRITGRQPFGPPPTPGRGDGAIYTKELTAGDPAFFQRPRDWRCSRTRRCRGNEEFHQFEYRADQVANDVRAAYSSDRYPWLVAVAKYTVVFHRPQDYDIGQLMFPESALPGEYVIQYNWRGYRDCWDVLLTAASGSQPRLIVQDVWVKHDHCQFENVDAEFGCSVLDDTADVTQCQQSCDDQPGCTGINVVPFNSNSFTRFGDEVNIPFNGRCRRRAIREAASEDSLVCYGLVPPPEPEVGTAFTTSDDPRDPIFYSTCYQKQRLTRVEGQEDTDNPKQSTERAHLVVDGCSTRRQAHEPRFAPDSERAGFVTCCAIDGSLSTRRIDGNCLGGSVGQNDPMKTYAEAEAICGEHQMRLCTSSDEVDRACGTGCGYDGVPVWTAQPQAPSATEKFIFGDQCISCEDSDTISRLPDVIVPRWKLAGECKRCR